MGITLSEISTFTQLLPLVQKAEPKISWLCARYILINPDQEVGIDAIARCMINLIKKNQNFSEKERPLVKEIAEHIDRIYLESDRLAISNCFFLTYIFIRIRDLFYAQLPYTIHSLTRWSWKECATMSIAPYNLRHELYTKEQLQKVRGGLPELKPQPSIKETPLWLLSGDCIESRL